EFLNDINQFEDREAAYSMIVYQCSRLFCGKPKAEFTYDLRDYPDCQTTLTAAVKLIGRSLQAALGDVEKRLRAAPKAELARRYAPVWYQDILIAVRKKPRRLADLLAAESAVINAVIDLGTEASGEVAARSARTITRALRNVQGRDMSRFGVAVLEKAA